MTQLTNIRGVVQGRTIELNGDVCLPDGESVLVTITTVNPITSSQQSHEKLEAAAGALEGLDDEIDAFNRWYREARRIDPRNLRTRESEQSASLQEPGEGLRRSAGAWAADTKEIDEFLEWNRRHR